MNFRTRFFLLTTCILFSASPILAGNPDKPGSELREKVVQFIDRPNRDILNYSAEYAEVEFMITARREIVVLGVACGNKKIEEYIKEKLNYRYVRVKDIVKHKPYLIGITFLRE